MNIRRVIVNFSLHAESFRKFRFSLELVLSLTELVKIFKRHFEYGMSDDGVKASAIFITGQY